MAKWKSPSSGQWEKINWRTRPGGEAFFGDTISVQFDDKVGPYLQELTASFPREFPRALLHASWVLRDEIRRAMRNGVTPDGQLDTISKMHMYRRMDLLKMGMGSDDGWKNGARFRLKKKLGYNRVKGSERLMDRWRGDARKGNIRSSFPMQGKLIRTIKTKVKGNLTFVVGAQNPVAMRWLEAAQAGRRGSRGVFQYLGQQSITPAMRRAFWAAGIPLKKGKTHIEQPERSVLAPVHRVFAQKLPDLMRNRIEDILNGNTGKKTDKAGLW